MSNTRAERDTWERLTLKESTPDKDGRGVLMMRPWLDDLALQCAEIGKALASEAKPTHVSSDERLRLLQEARAWINLAKETAIASIEVKVVT